MLSASNYRDGPVNDYGLSYLFSVLTEEVFALPESLLWQIEDVRHRIIYDYIRIRGKQDNNGARGGVFGFCRKFYGTYRTRDQGSTVLDVTSVLAAQGCDLHHPGHC